MILWLFHESVMSLLSTITSLTSTCLFIITGISTLVLPESDSETDDEEQKKLKSNDIQTLYIEGEI